MAKKTSATQIIKEITELKKQFDRIKADTEDFIKNLKRVSGSGVAEAKELMDDARGNWDTIVNAIEKSPFIQMLERAMGGGKKSAKKKTAKKSVKKKKK